MNCKYTDMLFELFLTDNLPSKRKTKIEDINYDNFQSIIIENIDKTTDIDDNPIEINFSFDTLLTEDAFYEKELKSLFKENKQKTFERKLNESFELLIEKYQEKAQNLYDEYALAIKSDQYDWIHLHHKSYEQKYGLPPYNPLMN